MLKRIKLRWLLLALIPIVAVIGVTAAHWVLRRQLSSQLAAALGTVPEIGSVSPGFRWHVAERVTFRGSDTSSNWLAVHRLYLHLPLADALRGNLKPRQVILDGVNVRITLDENGRPIGLPGEVSTTDELPADRIEIRGGRCEIHQPGRQPITADGIAGEVGGGRSRTAFNATILKLLGGSWSLQGTVSLTSRTASVNVKSNAFTFDTAQLSQLAGVPAWDQQRMQASGQLAVGATVAIDSGQQVTYHADVQLDSGQVRLEKNGIAVHDVAADLVADDGLLTIPHVSASVLGATVSANGKWDVNPGKEGGQLKVQLDGLAVANLPLEAKGVKDLDGKISGTADLGLSLREGKWNLAGSGQGKIEQGAWRGIPIEQLTCQFSLPSWILNASLALPETGQLETEFRITDRRLPTLLEAIAPDAPIQRDKLDGSLSVSGKATIPLQSIDQVETYSANATLTTNNVRIAELKVPRVVARMQLSNGLINLPDSSVELEPSGRLTANGTVDLAPHGTANVNVKFDDAPVSLAEPFLPDTLPNMSGAISGNVTAMVPWSQWNELRRWQGSAIVRIPELDVNQVKLAGLSTQLELTESRIDVSQAKLAWQDAELTGTAKLNLDDRATFEAEYNSNEFDLQRLLHTAGIQAAEKAEGKLTLTGRAAGQLTPFEWDAHGDVVIDDVRLLGQLASDVTIPWRASASNLEVHDASVSLLGGTLHLDASIPWRSPENSEINGRFDALDSGQLNQALDNLPAQLSGQISGTFSATNFTAPQQLQAHVDFNGLRAVTNVVKVNNLSGSIDVQTGTVTFTSSGDAFDGSVAVKGQADFPKNAWKPQVTSGSASFRNVRLQSLWSVLGQQQRLGLLRAVADAELKLTSGATKPQATGSLQLRDVQWGTTPITEAFTAQVELSEGLIRLYDSRCQIGRGMLDGELRYRLTERRGEIAVRGRRIPIDYLLAKWPKAASRTQGQFSTELKGSIGERCDIRGNVSVSRARLAGIPVSNVQAPVRWRIQPRSGKWEGTVTLQNTRIASGTATGQWQLGWNGALYVKGATNLKHVDVRPLAAAVPNVNNLLSGRLSGDFSLESRNLRTSQDLSGSYRLRLEQTQTLLLPVLESLTASLGLSSPTSLTFTHTDVVGNIGRGVMKVQEMSMVGPEARMWVVGQLGFGGVIDFDVTADTGGLSGINLVAGAINPLELLRRRLVFLHLSGSIRNPIVQPRTEQFLAQELVLFFLPVISLR
jgi:hypothetical protein